MALKDDLIAAKALIDTPEKWCKGAFGMGSTPKCINGALYWSGSPPSIGNGYGPRPGPQMASLIKALPSGFRTTARYNDDPATTHPDVMALFDRAILSAEASDVPRS